MTFLGGRTPFGQRETSRERKAKFATKTQKNTKIEVQFCKLIKEIAINPIYPLWPKWIQMICTRIGWIHGGQTKMKLRSIADHHNGLTDNWQPLIGGDINPLQFKSLIAKPKAACLYSAENRRPYFRSSISGIKTCKEHKTGQWPRTNTERCRLKPHPMSYRKISFILPHGSFTWQNSAPLRIKSGHSSEM